MLSWFIANEDGG